VAREITKTAGTVMRARAIKIMRETTRNSIIKFCGVLVASAALAAPALAESGDDDKFNPNMTSCEMVYNLSGWSVGYSTSKGEGRITCSNGQKAEVTIVSKAGGLTVGKSKIVGGIGRFTPVQKIDELFGSYAKAEAHAGAGDSAKAAVVTKGEISLTLAGQGQGVDLGVAIGNFVIKPVVTPTSK
jgi:hypothetical protein